MKTIFNDTRTNNWILSKKGSIFEMPGMLTNLSAMKRVHLQIFFLFLCLLPHFLVSQNNLQIEQKKDLFGIRNGKKWELAPKYDSILKISDECYVIKKNGLFGLYYQDQLDRFDFWGSERFVMVKPVFKQYNASQGNEFSLADKNGYYCLMDKKGKNITGFEFTRVLHQASHTLAKNKNGRWVLYTNTYPSGLECDSVYPYGGNTLLFGNKTQYGDFEWMIVINTMGNRSLTMDYNKDFGKKKTWIKIGDQYSLANSDLTVDKVRYDSVGILSNGNYIVKTNNKDYQLFSSELERLLPPNIDIINILADGNYMVRTHHGGYGIYTPQLDTVLPANYAYLKFENNSILALERMKKYSETGGAYNVFTTKGEPVLVDYNLIEPLTPGKYICKKNEWGNEKGPEDATYDIYEMGKGFIEKNLPAKPKLSGNYIRIDSDTYYYYTNETWTKKSKKFPVGYIPRTGTTSSSLFTFFLKAITVIPLVVDIVTGSNPMGGETYSYNEKVYGGDFENGYAMVGQKNSKKQIKFGLIDTSFQLVIPANYDELKAYEKIIFVRKVDHWAIINKKNELLSDYTFTFYSHYTDDFFIVYDDKSYQILDSEGKQTSFPHFKEYKYNKKGEIQLIVDTFERYTLTRNGELIPITGYNYD